MNHHRKLLQKLINFILKIKFSQKDFTKCLLTDRIIVKKSYRETLETQRQDFLKIKRQQIFADINYVGFFFEIYEKF